MIAQWIQNKGCLFWIIVIIIAILILWIFFGGKNYEVIGLKPLTELPVIIPEEEVHISKICENNPEISEPDSTYDISSIIKVEEFPESPNITYSENYIKEEQKPKLRLKIRPSPNYDNTPELHPLFQSNRSNRSSNSRKSKGEEITCRAAEKVFGVPFRSIRPDFLKNPETKRNLEIDCYNDQLKIGIEYSGEQHYKWPNWTGMSYEEFIKQIRRDIYKVDACDQNGVYLITVPYNCPHNKIEEFIRYYSPDEVLKRQK